MICVSIGNVNFETLKEYLPKIDMLELRIDLLSFTEDQYRYLLEKNKEVIVTFRDVYKSDDERLVILEKMMRWGANYVDIEVDANQSYKDKIIELAEQYRCKTILSYHNFEKTPSKESLEHIISKSEALCPYLIKIVTTPKTTKDVARVLSLYENYSNMIAFCMGEMGKISRLASLYLGAPYIYASFSEGNKTASGQLNYETLDQLQKIINIK